MRKGLCLLLLGSFLFSCGGKKDSKILIYALSANVVTFDPAKEVDVESNLIVENVCEPLVSYQANTEQNIQPLLADSWKISNSGKTYTFHLREGVTFFDGTPMNADAVLFSYLRQHDKNNPNYIQGPNWTSFGLRKNVISIKKLDDLSVEFKLRKPDSAFLAKMTKKYFSIVNPVAYKKMGEQNFEANPSCTGPFKIVSWKKSQMIVLEKNNNYWDNKNKAKKNKIIFKIMPDSSARLLALKKGEVDIIEKLSYQDVDAVKKDKDLMIVAQPTMYQEYLWFNVTKPPFNKVKVRQALAHLVDKKIMVHAATRGYSIVAVNPIPTSLWGYNNDIKDYDYNVKKAKKLLREAGYPSGFEMKMYFNESSPARKILAQVFQNSFAQVGVKVTLQSLEWGTFLNKAINRDYTGALFIGWFGYADPDGYLSVQFTKLANEKPANNVSGWFNPEFDKIVYNAVEITDKQKRIELYKKAQKILHNEVPVIPLYDQTNLYGLKKTVKGFNTSVLGDIYFSSIN